VQDTIATQFKQAIYALLFQPIAIADAWLDAADAWRDALRKILTGAPSPVYGKATRAKGHSATTTRLSL
jgi:hypothetical protein